MDTARRDRDAGDALLAERTGPMVGASGAERAAACRRHGQPGRTGTSHRGRQAGLHRRVGKRLVRERTRAAAAGLAARRAAGRDLRRRVRQLPAAAAVAAVGGSVEGGPQGARKQGKPRCPLPADGPHPVPHAPAAAQGAADARCAGDPVRRQCRHPADLHRRPGAAASGCAAVVVRLLSGPVGRRHVRSGNHQLQGRRMAGHRRQPAHRCREDDRALAPR